MLMERSQAIIDKLHFTHEISQLILENPIGIVEILYDCFYLLFINELCLMQPYKRLYFSNEYNFPRKQTEQGFTSKRGYLASKGTFVFK